jgi:hypothetical protein
MPLRDGFVLDPNLIKTTMGPIHHQSGATIVQLHRLRASDVIASSQCLGELLQWKDQL